MNVRYHKDRLENVKHSASEEDKKGFLETAND